MSRSTRKTRRPSTRAKRQAEAKATRDAKGSDTTIRELDEQGARRTAPTGKPKKPHRRKDVDLKAEGVDVKVDHQLKIYTAACKGDEAARKKVRAWKPETRRAFALRRLKGVNPNGPLFTRWVEEGITTTEQHDEAKAARLTRELLEQAARNEKSNRKSTREPKEGTVKKQTTRKQTTARTERKRQTVAEGRITARDIANEVGTDAKIVRRVLRANGIAKDEATGQYHWPSLKTPAVKKIIRLTREEVASK